jgi:hypothetical protein
MPAVCLGGRGMVCRWFALVAVFSGLAFSAHATTVNAPSFENLVGQSEYVVRGVVKSLTPEMQHSGANRRIITKVEVEVLEVISGTPPTPLVLIMPGGKIGDEEMVVDGVPQYSVGEEHVFFVKGNGRQFCPLVAVMHGSYAVKREPDTGRRYMVRSNGEPLYSEADVAKPMSSAQAVRAQHPKDQPLSPEAFATRVKQRHEQLKPTVRAN